MKETINKAVWLSALECRAMGWFGLRDSPDAPDEASLFRMQQGQEIGVLARDLFPGGVLVSKLRGKEPVEITRDLISDKSIEVLFEPSFRAGQFAARADVLKRENGAWHVLEVKSNLPTTGNMERLILDLAYTVMVVRRSGLPVTKASLVLLSPEYRLEAPPNQLFTTLEVTADVDRHFAAFEPIADRIAHQLFADVQPAATLVSGCRDCSYFEDQCLGSGIAHTVFEIPRLHASKLKLLSAAGIVDLAQVPDDFRLNDRQQNAKIAALSGNVMVETGLRAALDEIDWPCHYLDFETVMTAVPIYEGHACYKQIVTQFSIHHRDSPDAEIRHSEFLADADRDCQRELAEALISALDQPGSVMMYSPFEHIRIKALRDAFPDLARPLQAILDRLKDLLPIIQDNLCHHGFRGSYSIKKVLPALVPEVSYAGLEIADGFTAIARFARMAKGEISGEEIASTRQALLDYCKMDTLAMVKLHEAVSGFVPRHQGAGR